MDVKIEGDPGTGNTFQEIHIGHVENYNPNATTVNNYYGTRGKSQAADTPADNATKRKAILEYVEHTKAFVVYHWQEKYMELWADILNLPEVNAIIYGRGRQEGTTFNRKEVCHIIHYLGKEAIDGGGIFKQYNATKIARAFNDGAELSVRPELGYNPPREIREAIEALIGQKRYVEQVKITRE